MQVDMDTVQLSELATSVEESTPYDGAKSCLVTTQLPPVAVRFPPGSQLCTGLAHHATVNTNKEKQLTMHNIINAK